MVDSEMLRLLKYGKTEEVRLSMGTKRIDNYSNSFPAFIDEMLKERKVKRKAVAIRSGLSQDYTYKLLRGDKRTTERDYILAICLAIGMNLAQTQHALQIYGMPILDKRDLRSQVIILGVEDGCSIDEINGFLEKAGFPYLRTSPGMPAAEIRPITDRNDSAAPKKHEYKEVHRDISAKPCGMSPLDFEFSGLIHLQDEENEDYTIGAFFHSEGAFFFAMPGKPEKLSDSDERDPGFLETFESLIDASSSSFFSYYLELDKATDEKEAETLAMVDDTKNYGTRIGCHIMGGEKACYLEAFNSQEPERCEYFQVIRTEKGYTYSITHKSLFLRIEMGKIYSAYYGEQKEEPKYLLKVTDPAEAGKTDVRYKFIFTDLRHYLNEVIRKQYEGFFPSEETNDELVETYAQQATFALKRGDIDEAIRLNREVYDISTLKSDVESVTVSLITAWKLGRCFAEINDLEGQAEWLKRAVSYADTAQAWYENEETRPAAAHVADILADAYRTECISSYRSGQAEKAKQNALESIKWYRICELSDDTAFGFVDTLGIYAHLIDEEDPERSLEYTGEAMRVARKYQIDQTQRGIKMLEVVMNNHAWVLWNRLGMEEAIIYYGQAIDLLETAILDKDNPELVSSLENVAAALYEIYVDTGKEKERDRLAARMKKYGLDISDPEN